MRIRKSNRFNLKFLYQERSPNLDVTGYRHHHVKYWYDNIFESVVLTALRIYDRVTYRICLRLVICARDKMLIDVKKELGSSFSNNIKVTKRYKFLGI